MTASEQTMQYKEVVDLYQLFAAPLLATIAADFYSAMRFSEYLREVGFEGDGKDLDWGKLRMVRFSYASTNTHGEPIQKIVEIPAVSMVPLPLLQIQTASFDMNVKILGAEQKQEKPRMRTAAINGEPAPEALKLKASLSSLDKGGDKKSTAPAISANLNAKVEMRHADMPAGLAKLLNVTQDATYETNARYVMSAMTDMILLDQQKRTIEIVLTGRDGGVIAGGLVDAQLEAGSEHVRLKPARVVTDKQGRAVFHVRRAKRVLEAPETARIVFISRLADPVRVNVTIPPDWREDDED